MDIVERLRGCIHIDDTMAIADEAADEIESLQAARAEDQARIRELRDALMSFTHIEDGFWEQTVGVGIDEILSRPADYSALNEALAKECERLAYNALGIDDMNTCDWLHEEAAAHRAKKGGKHEIL